MSNDTETLTLTAFLLARIEEDQTAAKTIAEEIAKDAGSWASIVRDHAELAAGDCPSYLAEYDPARVLAECAAKRAIVQIHAAEHECSDWVEGEVYFSAYHGRPITDELAFGREDNCDTLRYLGAIYADHPDFKPDWA